LICWKSDSDDALEWHYNSSSRVSILDLLEVGFRRAEYHRASAGGGVSILDLLEVGFRRAEYHRASAGGGVSILDLLEVGFRHGSSVRLVATKDEFQSLICWKSDSDSIWLAPYNSTNLSFNP